VLTNAHQTVLCTHTCASLQARASADPNDPVLLQLEDQLRALGPAPRRLAPVTPTHRAEALAHAAQRVALGEVGQACWLPGKGRLYPPQG